MTTFDVAPIRMAGLRSESVLESGVVSIRLVGAAEAGAVRPLDDFLRRTHGKLLELATLSVTVDLRELEFMNSSCFKAFVTWLGSLQELEPARQYRVRFVANAKLHWQRRSLDALRRFAAGLVEIID